MAEVGKVDVKLGLDGKQFEKGIKDAQAKTERFANATKVALGAVVAGLSFERIKNELISYYKAVEDCEKINRQLTQTLRATGYASDMTASELIALSDELQELTGIDGDVIKSAENILLTFKLINRDVFPQAIALVLDMSRTMGQDLNSAAVQVGKALNDPIQGVTALRRVGVQLTEQQTEMIKKFMEQGEILKAQKIIIQELTSQFGGAAKASKTYTDQIVLNIEDLREELGRLIGLDNAVTKFIANITNAAKEMARQFRVATTDIEKLTLSEAKLRLEQAESGASFTRNLPINKKYIEQIKERIKYLEQEEQKEKAKYQAQAKSNTAVIKKVKKEKEENQILKDLISQEIQGNISERAFEEAGGYLASLSTEFQGRLNLLKWYYTEYERITNSKFKTVQDKMDAYNQLEVVKMQKQGELERNIWLTRMQTVKSIFSSTLSTMLTNYGSFSDNMKQLALNLTNYIIGQIIQQEIAAINTERVLSALGSFGGSVGGFFSGLFKHSGGMVWEKHHSGKMFPDTDQTEHLGILKNNERVLSPAETVAYNSGQSQQPNYIVYAPQVRAMDSRDVASWFNENKSQIISIVSNGIKNNSNGIRTQVQNA